LHLIGGAPRCGKTTLARRLAQALGCSHVPADYLGSAFANYIAGSLHDPRRATKTHENRRSFRDLSSNFKDATIALFLNPLALLAVKYSPPSCDFVDSLSAL